MARSTPFGTFGLIAVLLGVLIIVPFVLRQSRIFEGFEAMGYFPYKKPNGGYCYVNNNCKSKKCIKNRCVA